MPVGPGSGEDRHGDDGTSRSEARSPISPGPDHRSGNGSRKYGRRDRDTDPGHRRRAMASANGSSGGRELLPHAPVFFPEDHGLRAAKRSRISSSTSAGS